MDLALSPLFSHQDTNRDSQPYTRKPAHTYHILPQDIMRSDTDIGPTNKRARADTGGGRVEAARPKYPPLSPKQLCDCLGGTVKITIAITDARAISVHSGTQGEARKSFGNSTQHHPPEAPFSMRQGWGFLQMRYPSRLHSWIAHARCQLPICCWSFRLQKMDVAKALTVWRSPFSFMSRLGP